MHSNISICVMYHIRRANKLIMRIMWLYGQWWKALNSFHHNLKKNVFFRLLLRTTDGHKKRTKTLPLVFILKRFTAQTNLPDRKAFSHNVFFLLLHSSLAAVLRFHWDGAANQGAHTYYPTRTSQTLMQVSTRLNVLLMTLFRSCFASLRV